MSIAQLFESGEQSRQKGHFRNLVLLARIDGELVASESGLLARVARRLSITDAQVKEIFNDANNYPMIPPSNREERYERFIQLVQMICVDGSIDPREEALAKKFAIALGFTEKSLDDKYETIKNQLLAGKTREEVLENIM
ncbi:MAG: TerB family tellurite resistance protein [Bacteroidetes bacterium]|nr:TerB family tellurite resistance protein [Bacteroidota bacterium]